MEGGCLSEKGKVVKQAIWPSWDLSSLHAVAGGVFFLTLPDGAVKRTRSMLQLMKLAESTLHELMQNLFPCWRSQKFRLLKPLDVPSSLTLEASIKGMLGWNAGAGTRTAGLFQTTRIFALFPTSCAGRGQLSFYRHGTQVVHDIATLDTMEEKTE